MVNDPAFFLSHRLPIAQTARSQGFNVLVATPPGAAVAEIMNAGFPHIAFPLSRWGINPIQEFRTCFALWRIYRRLQPDLVHHVTIKPVIYGSFAARFSPVKGIVNALPGLGHVFSSRGVGAYIRKIIVRNLYRLAFRLKNLRVIFQNTADRNQAVSDGFVAENAAALIRGSGVDITHFTPSDEPTGRPIVILPCRLLNAKGVKFFVEAAHILQSRGHHPLFKVIGDHIEGHPDSISTRDLEKWKSDGLVHFVGYSPDMATEYRESNIVCLPTVYGEGVPKTLLEAAACARVIVASDIPGCREIVEHNSNGFLVPPFDSQALARALESLLIDPALRERMGENGRRRVEKEGFSTDVIASQTLDVYLTLLKQNLAMPRKSAL